MTCAAPSRRRGDVWTTQAGYLPPAIVESFAERSGITAWFIGKTNREDLTWPAHEVGTTARALGLVTVRTGQLSPTAAGARVCDDGRALWRHIMSRLPLGTKDILEFLAGSARTSRRLTAEDAAVAATARAVTRRA